MFHLIRLLYQCCQTKWLSLAAAAIAGSILAGPCHAQNTWVDLVRVEDGEFSRDIVYQLNNGQWQKPLLLTRGSRTDEFTPVSFRVTNRRALVVWKELTGVDASNLLFCFIHFDPDGNVSSVSDIESIKTNTAHQSSPTLLRDLQGRILGFWVGFNGKDDDIYFAEFSEDRWSEEKRVFTEDNDVPDLRPTARLNLAGIAELRWRQFSFDEGAYIDVFSALEQEDGGKVTGWSPPKKYVFNPLEKIPRLPQGFSLPEGVSVPDSVAINHSGDPNVVLHWDKLPRDDNLSGTAPVGTE